MDVTDVSISKNRWLIWPLIVTNSTLFTVTIWALNSVLVIIQGSVMQKEWSLVFYSTLLLIPMLGLLVTLYYGICGSVRQSVHYLKLYQWIGWPTVVGFMVFGAYWFFLLHLIYPDQNSYRIWFGKTEWEGLYTNWSKYANVSSNCNASQFWPILNKLDDFQRTYKCCGWESVGNFSNTDGKSCGEHNLFPKSCCQLDHQDCKAAHLSLHQESCEKALNPWGGVPPVAHLLIYISVGILIVLLVVAYSLRNKIKKIRKIKRQSK